MPFGWCHFHDNWTLQKFKLPSIHLNSLDFVCSLEFIRGEDSFLNCMFTLTLHWEASFETRSTTTKIYLSISICRRGINTFCRGGSRKSRKKGPKKLMECPPRGVLPYMSYIGMCRCEGYGFQRVYSGIGYRKQRVLV